MNPLPPAPIRVILPATIPPTPKPRSKTKPRSKPKPRSKKKKRKDDDDKGDCEDDGDQEYVIDNIVSGPNHDGCYEVKWDGYTTDENTWEPSDSLPQWLITEFKGRTNDDEVEEGHSCSDSEDDDVPFGIVFNAPLPPACLPVINDFSFTAQ